ncbi:hypothetical protein CEXT_213311 [Caerostris extrusa]|uniref:Secreted protein n=1 Tax=Caerostris extrusa TaxID=172846 RepID=A0AAV4Q8P9_CAEEX|nr:hypothetical protein CEXT_213311 [Caerostris extrusa]
MSKMEGGYLLCYVLVFTLLSCSFRKAAAVMNTISTLPKSSPTTPSNLCCPTPVGKEERATRCTTTTASATTPASRTTLAAVSRVRNVTEPDADVKCASQRR